ncbi:MAG: replication endonuclease [Oceanospirillaceae bacterium]|nr:replication endonuclease [Oceanospirillaceae bacterium]
MNKFDFHSDQKWAESLTASIPFELKSPLYESYSKISSRFEANTFLRKSVEQIKKATNLKRLDAYLNWNEDDLRRQAKISSEHCVKSVGKSFANFKHLSLLTAFPVNRLLSDAKAVNDFNKITSEAYRVFLRLSGYLKSKGLDPIALDNPIRSGNPLGLKENALRVASEQLTESCIKQVRRLLTTLFQWQDYCWWVRQLRKSLNRQIETAAHAANRVNLHKGVYASDISVNRRRGQIKRNQRLLEQTLAVNELGDSFTLAELSNKNVSNPVNRRAELMVRIRGNEDFANQEGLKGVFMTITCPSKYHRSLSVNGAPNPKWAGYTPKLGQDYLNNVWQLIRAAFQRANIQPLGVRVAEPQHDGTPHWHLLLFIDPSQLDEMVAICRFYAMREDGDEAGANKYRFDAKPIDAKKGSATGYIAKYICKNIDGANLESGIYGEDPIEAAHRVETWRSVWGIRQFEFIGGCSVTAWRELRRLPDKNDLPEEVESIRKAADDSNWSQFNELMGGFFCKRKEQKLRPHYSVKFDSSTGEVKESKYGDSFIERLIGLKYKAQTIVTRLHEWRVEKIERGRAVPLGVL